MVADDFNGDNMHTGLVWKSVSGLRYQMYR